MPFNTKMAWPPATYDATSRNHSNWPLLNLSQDAREGWTNSYWKHQLLIFYRLGKNSKKTLEGGEVAKTCLATNQLVASCVNTDFWLDKISRESRHTSDLRHLLQCRFALRRKNAQHINFLLQEVELLSDFLQQLFATCNTGLICCKTGWFVGGGTCIIAIQLVGRFCCPFYMTVRIIDPSWSTRAA